MSRNICCPSEVCYISIVLIGYGDLNKTGNWRPVILEGAVVVLEVYDGDEPMLPMLVIVVDMILD